RPCLSDMSSTKPAQIYDVEATKIASDFEVNSARCSVFGKETTTVDIYVYMQGQRRGALREGAIGNNVEARPNSRGHIVLARWYVQVGCDLRSVRRRQHHSVVIA